MRVVRLEVFGFKSFMDRLVLNLPEGVTGVVGPNGCGKSNIVDAIRWVLGETKAKQLRGGVLEDIIFNGTSSLRPLGLAEVTLTVRSESDNLYEDLRQVAEKLVSAEGLVDIGEEDEADAVTDATTVEAESQEGEEQEAPEAEGAPQLKVISGDKDSSDDSAEGDKPSLTVLGAEDEAPEAANDAEESAEESTDAEAQKQPDLVQELSATLLNRFTWLKDTGEVQVTRRLYRSGESEFFINRVPCRLRDVKEFFRAVGLSARSHTIVAQGEVGKIVNAKAEERRTFIEDAAGILGFREKISSSERKLKQTSDNLERVEDIIVEVSRQVASLKRQALKAQNRQRLKDELKEAEESLFLIRRSRLSEECRGLEEELTTLRREEESLVAAKDRARADEEKLRGDLLALDVEGDQLRIKIDSLRDEINRRNESKLQSTARLQELEAFRKAQETEIKRCDEREELLKERGAELSTSLEELDTQLAALKLKIEEIGTSASELLSSAEQELKAARAEVSSVDEKLRDEKVALAKLSGKRALLEEQLEAVSRLSAGAEGAENLEPIFAQISVPEEYTLAVKAALRGRSRFFSVDTWAEALQSVSSDADTSLPGVFVAEALKGSSNDSLPSASGLTPLADLLEGTSEELKALFARCYFAESAEAATAAFQVETIPSDAICVTAKAELIDRFSFGRDPEDATDPLVIRQQIEELDADSAKIQSRISEIEAERAELLERVAEKERAHSDALAKRNEEQAELQSLSQERGALQGRISSEGSNRKQVQHDLEAVSRSREAAKQRIEELEREKEQLLNEVKRLSSEGDDDIREELGTHHSRYAELEEARKGQRHELSKFVGVTQESQEKLEKLRARVADLRLEVEKRHMSEESGEIRMREDYGDEQVDALIAKMTEEGFEAPEGEPDELRSDAARIRTRLQREGEVDPSSIERYEEEAERLNYLKSQREDLSSASQTLQETIERLRLTSEQLFMKNFENIRANFVKLIPRLFGGGKGDIVLQDPTQPLDTGIEITVRPPGKRPKSIDLLSGGEKALCATALIISMFMERPSPLCILDEVDAPLDEANLERFLAIINEMSTKTQFMMITHNKASMTACSQLVGVTMEQPGASKVLSVSLQEAIRHVA